MAKYTELHECYTDPVMRIRAQVAAMVAAGGIVGELDTVPNHTERVAWAARALAFPVQEGLRLLAAILAANKDLEKQIILDATDAQLQAKANDAVDTVALGTAA